MRIITEREKGEERSRKQRERKREREGEERLSKKLLIAVGEDFLWRESFAWAETFTFSPLAKVKE